MERSGVSTLGYIELGVSDLAAWKKFAESVLGLACESNDKVLYARADHAVWRFRIVASGEDDLLCAGFQVEDEQSLESLQKHLTGLGISVSEASEAEATARHVDRLLYCNDPDGLRIELYVGERPGEAMFTSPSGVSGFVTGALGLGHIVLFVNDPAKTEAFYKQGLNFSASDHILMGPPDRQVKLSFLHCNPRHHTLAYICAPSKKRLHHFMLEVEDIDDVGRAADLAAEAGTPIVNRLGRHTNDHMISFYMMSPSGFQVEYGFGGRLVEESGWKVSTYDSASRWGHRPV